MGGTLRASGDGRGRIPRPSPEARGRATLAPLPHTAEDAVGRARHVGAVFVAAGLQQLVFLERDEADERRGDQHGEE